jgi:hypothetical protein
VPQRIPLFGAFLRPDHPLFSEYNPKFRSRISEMETQAIMFHEAFSTKYAEAAPHLTINFINIHIAVSRYFNDLIRMRTMHDISRLHRTKISAYTAKWVWLNPIMQSSADFAEFLTLDLESRHALASANFLFVCDLVRYFMPKEIEYADRSYELVLGKFLYAMKIGVFEEHLAAALLETISPISNEGDNVDY